VLSESFSPSTCIDANDSSFDANSCVFAPINSNAWSFIDSFAVALYECIWLERSRRHCYCRLSRRAMDMNSSTGVHPCVLKDVERHIMRFRTDMLQFDIIFIPR